jgi:hypothetical protein
LYQCARVARRIISEEKSVSLVLSATTAERTQFMREFPPASGC